MRAHYQIFLLGRNSSSGDAAPVSAAASVGRNCHEKERENRFICSFPSFPLPPSLPPRSAAVTLGANVCLYVQERTAE